MSKKFSQVCVWPGTVIGNDKIKEFVKFMKDEFGVRVKYLEEISTLPDVKDGETVKGTGGRNDIFFSVHNDDISKFAVPRLRAGIRWIEDVLASVNGGLTEDGKPTIYPERVLEYKTWENN